MILLTIDPGAPELQALLIFCTLPVMFNLLPFLAHKRSGIILALYFIPLFLYIVVITYFTIINSNFYWSFRGDFLIISMCISLLNLLIINFRRQEHPED